MRDRLSPRNAGAGPGGQGDLGTALQFGITIILFTFAGRWLDSKLGTAPVMLLLGMCVGAAAGFYSMYRKLTAGEKKGHGRVAGEPQDRQRGDGDRSDGDDVKRGDR